MGRRIDSAPEKEPSPIAAFRFVHTADVHLDSPLRSLALREQALADLVADATRAAFARTVDLCLEEQVDALLIAGDLYDGDQTSMKTARFVAAQFKRLADAGVRVFAIRGNHDNLSRVARELTPPDNVKVFGGRAGIESVERQGGKSIAIHGLSFAEAHAPESLLPKYRPPVEDAFNIGLMHTSLGGSPGHDVYAPVSLADLEASGFRYWALGHIHKRGVWQGQATVVMSGMPQGRHVNEDGPKSVTLATVCDDGSITIEERAVGAAVFRRTAIDLSGAEDWSRLSRSIAAGLGGDADRQSIHRVSLGGATPLAWRIRRDLDLLLGEVEVELGARAGVWIERIETAFDEVSTGADGAGPLAELEKIMASDVLPSEGFRHEAMVFGESFVKQLPAELRRLLGDDEAAVAAALSRLAAQGAADVLAKLGAAPAEDTA